MDLQGAAKMLSDALGRAGQAGHFEALDDDEVNDIFADLRDLGLEPSRALRAFYRMCDPLSVEVRPWVYGALVLYPVRELIIAHDPVVSDNGRKENWRSRWIVIATAVDDPYFVDAAKPSLPVYTDTVTAGALKPKLVASSLDGFLRLCAKWIETFPLAGVGVNPRVLHSQQDFEGEAKSRAAWTRFRAWLALHDSRASESEFWQHASD